MTDPSSAAGKAEEDEELARLVDDGAAVDESDLPEGAQNAPGGDNLTPSESDSDS